MAFGDGRDFVACFVNIDLVAVGNWAERNGVTYASYQELAGHPLVYDMVARHVDEVNRSLAGEPRMGGAQIRRFLILHKELDADDGELTRTQKVRRGFIAERYAPLIAALVRRLAGGGHLDGGDVRGRAQGRDRGAGDGAGHGDGSGRGARPGEGGVRGRAPALPPLRGRDSLPKAGRERGRSRTNGPSCRAPPCSILNTARHGPSPCSLRELSLPRRGGRGAR